MTARNVHITDQALAALKHRGVPMTTREVAEAIGEQPWQQDTWRVLTRLARQCRIERVLHMRGAYVMWQTIGGAEWYLGPCCGERDDR